MKGKKRLKTLNLTLAVNLSLAVVLILTLLTGLYQIAHMYPELQSSEALRLSGGESLREGHGHVAVLSQIMTIAVHGFLSTAAWVASIEVSV